MKLHQEDPRLTAYLLGELSPKEAEAVESATATDEAVRAVLGDTSRMCTDLKALLGSDDGDHLLPKHRENIRKAAKVAASQGKIEQLKSHRQVRKVWQIPLAAAAVIGGGIFLLTLISSPKRGGTKPVATKTDTRNSDNTGIEAVPSDGNVMLLPLEAGKRSLSLITNAVRIDDRMPTQQDVRIEELLNAFPLKAKGTAALWKGCSLAAEILPCPWRPSGNLIFVSLQGARDGDRKLSIELQTDGNSTSNHRLLGYSIGAGDMNVAAAVTTIPAGESVVLVIEAVANRKGLGTLTWTVDGAGAPPMDLVFNPEKEPSDDASFATLICGFGLWLRGEGKPTIDDLLVLALAREAAAGNLVADRYDFITLVDQAVKLSE